MKPAFPEPDLLMWIGAVITVWVLALLLGTVGYATGLLP